MYSYITNIAFFYEYKRRILSSGMLNTKNNKLAVCHWLCNLIRFYECNFSTLLLFKQILMHETC